MPSDAPSRISLTEPYDAGDETKQTIAPATWQPRTHAPERNESEPDQDEAGNADARKTETADRRSLANAARANEHAPDPQHDDQDATPARCKHATT